MKQYPRISRLSTVGLRQHQAFDYDFHPFRTDFIGESGCGKSMIADLLQLILVGSEQFQSATEALGGPRLPGGMVLKDKDKRGTDSGYTFLTIETEQEKYVVIGAYIEAVAKNTVAFIIQAGFVEDDLIPVNDKLSFEDVLKDNKILPIDELKIHLNERGLLCQSWVHKRLYHKYLYKNKLLSLDLSDSDKILKDYAKIIQSFSRGKFIDTQKEESLKQFLFGDEKAKELFNRYQTSAKDLQVSFNEYDLNLKEIELVTKKQRKLSRLLEDEKEMKRLLFEWLYTWCMHAYQEEARIRHEMKQTLHATISAKNALLTLGKVMKMEYSDELTKKSILEELERQYKNVLYAISLEYSQIGKIRKLLNDNQLTIDLLHERHTKSKLLSSLKAYYEKIDRHLHNKGLKNYFSASWQNRGKSDLVAFLVEEIGRQNSILDEKKAFRQFVDLNNKGSLGSWALESRRSFTIEEESIIFHYKTLSTKKPTSRAEARYFPAPNIFLQKISIEEPDDNGFWLNLNGLREYISLVQRQVFTRENIENIESFFQQWSKDLEMEIGKLENSILEADKLKQFAIEEREFDHYIDALRQKEEVDAYVVDDLSRLTEEELQQLLITYRDADRIEHEYAEADQNYKTCLSDTISISNYLKIIEQTEKKVAQLIGENDWIALANEIRMALGADDIRILEDDGQLIKFFRDELYRKTDKALYVTEAADEYKGKMKTWDLKKFGHEWNQILESKEKSWEEYKKNYDKYPEEPLSADKEPTNGDSKKAQYEALKRSFESSYKEIVEEFLPNDAYKFDNVYDCVALAVDLLPAAFQGNPTSDTLIESVDYYLKRINDSNRELNKRKLQKIRDLLDDVNDVVSKRLTDAKRIDNFLNDKVITGGHRVRLQVGLSKEYPKTWIDTFQRRLNNDADDLISEEVTKGVSLEEKMIAAFNACTTTAITRPKIEKLLDPNAYLELSFSMESSSGQINKGSTGQTYASIALLCIARLSIIGIRDDRKTPSGIRFMPIDEAEGLGSNYDMLYNIAKDYDYQIISLSINPLGKFQDGKQYIYMLQKNTETDADINYQPYAIFCEEDKLIHSL